MESLQDSNLSDDVHTVCYNMNTAYFKIGDFLNWYIANCVVGTLLAIAATLENLCVLLTILKTSILHIPSNMILFCLALSDLGVGLLSCYQHRSQNTRIYWHGLCYWSGRGCLIYLPVRCLSDMCHCSEC